MYESKHGTFFVISFASYVHLIWLQLAKLTEISCSLCRSSYGRMLACKHITATEVQPILTLALQLV